MHDLSFGIHFIDRLSPVMERGVEAGWEGDNTPTFQFHAFHKSYILSEGLCEAQKMDNI